MIRNLKFNVMPGRKLTLNSKNLSRYLIIAPLFLLVSLLSSCTREASNETVEAVSEKYFHAIQQKDFDTALSFYAKEFFDMMPKSTWKKHLIEVSEKLGSLQKVKLKRKNTSTVFSGRRFVFVFSNQYEKGLAKETIIFFQHVSKPDIIIQSHKIESSKLPGSQIHR